MFCCVCVGESRKDLDGEAEKVKALPAMLSDDRVAKEDMLDDTDDGRGPRRTVRLAEAGEASTDVFFSTSPADFRRSRALSTARSARPGEDSQSEFFFSASPAEFYSARLGASQRLGVFSRPLDGMGQEDDMEQRRSSGLQEKMLEKFLGTRPDLTAVSKTFANVGNRRQSIENVSMEEYAGQHAYMFENLLNGEHDPRWAPRKAMEGLEVFQFFEEAHQMTAVKAVISLNLGKRGGLEFLAEKILDVTTRREYDETCLHGRIVEQHLPQYSVMYVQIETPTPFVTNRDLVMLARLRFEEDGTLLIALTSTKHDDAPSKPDFIRATMAAGGYIIRPTEDPDVYQVTYLVEVDAGGLLPAFVQKVLAWKQGLTLLNFKKTFDL